jgi:biotin operon repressor
MMPDDEIQNAVNTLKNAGFKIDTKSKKIKTPA